MTKILICSNHQLTADQQAHLQTLGLEPVLLADVAPAIAEKFRNHKATEIDNLVASLLDVCAPYGALFLPIGSPAFMVEFSRRCSKTMLFSETERNSVEELQSDGSVKKLLVFKHTGFTYITSPCVTFSKFEG